MNANQQETLKKRPSFAEVYNKVGIFFILIIFVILSACMSRVFLTQANIINLLTQTSVVTIIACGITLLIITGNTDLSAGSMVAFGGCFILGTFKQLTQNMGLPDVLGGVLAILAGVVLCVAMYGAAALVITIFNAPAFIVTLAISTAARGLALMYTDGKVIKQCGNIVKIGQAKLFGVVPFPVLFMIVFLIITWVLLTQTRFGKHVYAVGGNMESARAAGIHTGSVIMRTYLYHAICVAFAGALFMARLNSGQPAEAVGLEFDAITAAIIGGASLAGGLGTISGTLVGSMIIGILANVFTLMHVQSYYQQIITGLIIVLAVVVDIKTKGGKRT
ncbi:MAG TPA: ABC transporter permease [Candidatus Pullichristensenella excrementigallinarum]|uniref:ABC transporter permease n=1 Tax=Candidatus Pullichristensenella excrementigallinarum TaxID=2840907 RepID=A0A9D1LDK0_9FIRM|nr:ABC transporter permease [Candidatus Pullichristensenella excrementigallinarum]